MDDTISREEVKKTLKMLIPGLKWSAIDWMVDGIPSAQQEIIRCKDCKYNDFEEQNSTTKWLPCIDAAWYDDWFCGCAERRTDG